MKTYVAPEAKISMFDVEDIITTSAETTTVNTAGLKIAEVNFADLTEDLSSEVNVFE